MSSNARQIVLTSSLLLALAVIADSQTLVPTPLIWDDRALADWATPLAALKVRPAHYLTAEYYAVPADNLRTYPVYRPDREPAGYWEDLQKKKPEPLVGVSKIRTTQDWIDAGARAFRDLDTPLARTDDPALISKMRDPRTFENVPGLADGTVREPRWVVTDRGVMLTAGGCSSCHATVGPDRTMRFATPPGRRAGAPPGAGPASPPGSLQQLVSRAAQRTFGEETVGTILKRTFDVPWDPDPRMERFFNLTDGNLAALVASPHGVIARANGSPFYGTRVPDLQILRYSRYIDATGTHRLRGPEDVARYAALINDADPMTFGTHRMLTDAQRKVKYRYADEVLYAIGVYLLSLEPPKNPEPPPADLVERGTQVFRREKCGACHPAPDYTTGELTPALGFKVPFGHPSFSDVRDRSVGTDPGLALRTRKGTGFYKIPSLRGLWYRPRLLHDASILTLEELFDAARLDPEYERKGWSAPGVTKGAIPGLEFLTKLSPEDKRALIAFLRSL
jgi:hypothetical protein